MSKPETITIDDVQFVRADSLKSLAPSVDGMDYVVVRTYSDGVHVGYLAEKADHHSGFAVKLLQARRCNRFQGCGGFSGCSELAQRGPDPKVARITDPQEWHKCVAIGITPVTAEAKKRLDACHD